MGLIKVYGEAGEKQVVTVSLSEALRVPNRIPQKYLLWALAVALAFDIAFAAAFLNFIFGRA